LGGVKRLSEGRQRVRVPILTSCGINRSSRTQPSVARRKADDDGDTADHIQEEEEST